MIILNLNSDKLHMSQLITVVYFKVRMLRNIATDFKNKGTKIEIEATFMKIYVLQITHYMICAHENQLMSGT